MSEQSAGIDLLVAEALLRDFVERVLPSVNREVESLNGGMGDLRCMMQAFRPTHELLSSLRVRESGGGRLPDARPLLQMLTFVGASVERHAQGRHAKPGTGIGRVPEIPRLLQELSEVTAHPPCGTAETYWLWNNGQRLSFLGSEAERFFGTWVRRTDQVVGRSAAALRAVVRNELPIGHEAVEQLQWVANDLSELREGFRSFMPPVRSQWPLSPQEFNRMRQYLVGYPVAGEFWPGINAANLGSQAGFDALLGTTTTWYMGVIYSRLRLLPDEARKLLANDLLVAEGQGTLLDLVARQFGLTPHLREYSSAELSRLFTTQPAATALARAVIRVAQAWAALSGTHWRMITEYLVRWRPDASQPILHVVNPPDRSTGGAPHMIPERIRRLRHENPLIHAIHAALPRDAEAA